MIADNGTVVASIGRDHYKTELTAGTHTLLADEHTGNGGTDSGPMPGDFMRMALASCTAITLRMYADRKKMDIERIDVTVNSERTDYKTVFKCEIKITGNITDEQRERMEDIAHKCPVHNVLSHPIEIDTWIAH
ncbi:putative redox protein [Chryseolinea serpens]|uniref:Putative redox protein n=1 Tax=Chryseolinea serpens TaxID=947013 RepID=A0A1M5XAT1_9BACT|nr:OsmC family protein [Chryseolinea serpens]SHH96614.1 putative redox protein [Chryseolinea serpens]